MVSARITPDWIAVDWGTSALRAFAMRGTARIAEAASAEGMASLTPDGFEPALLRLVGPWLGSGTTPVIACGMVGARQGWAEAPYRPVPCPPVAAGETLRLRARDPRLAVEIVPGLCQHAPADVMRGEETQIAGFLAEEPGFAGTLILPGTHSKHVRVAGGRVTGFTTWMTGELFALLATQSVLRLTLAPDGTDPAAFRHGVRQGLDGGGLAGLFALRAEALLAGLDPVAARARLSGLLIGAELAAQPPAQDCVVIGAEALARAYLDALAQAGIAARAIGAGALVCRGLALARNGGTT